MAAPATRDITLVKNRAYDHVIYVGPGLTGYTFSAVVRADPTATSTPDATFAIDTSALATDSSITLSLEAAQTTTLAPKTMYRWDLKATDEGGRPHPWLQGSVTVLQDVTH